MHSWVRPKTGEHKHFWLPVSISDRLRERVRQRAKSFEGAVNAMILAIVLMSYHGGDNRPFPLDRRALSHPESVLFKILGFTEHQFRDAIELLRKVGFVQESADGEPDSEGRIPATFVKFKRNEDGTVKLFPSRNRNLRKRKPEPHRRALIYRFGDCFYRALVRMHERVGRYIRTALSRPMLEGTAPIPPELDHSSHRYCQDGSQGQDDGVEPCDGGYSSCGTNPVASVSTAELEPTPMIEQIIGMMEAGRYEGTIMFKLDCTSDELRLASRIMRERRISQ